MIGRCQVNKAQICINADCFLTHKGTGMTAHFGVPNSLGHCPSLFPNLRTQGLVYNEAGLGISLQSCSYHNLLAVHGFKYIEVCLIFFWGQAENTDRPEFKVKYLLVHGS